MNQHNTGACCISIQMQFAALSRCGIFMSDDPVQCTVFTLIITMIVLGHYHTLPDITPLLCILLQICLISLIQQIQNDAIQQHIEMNGA